MSGYTGLSFTELVQSAVEGFGLWFDGAKKAMQMLGETLHIDEYMPYIIMAVAVIIAVCVIVRIVRRILRSPFRYPYFEWFFDVSGKRNVDLTDYIDRFLCDDANWQRVLKHQSEIQEWCDAQVEYLSHCKLKKRRARQLDEAVDDEHAFRFIAIRKQTRYRQSNYVRASYKVDAEDSEMSVSWQWLMDRHMQLAQIGFECTLKEYNSSTQRKLMTPALRKQIAERDNYTCQICGKYMPDGVGLQIDHIVPVAKGGKTVPSNLRVLCSKCNGRKGAK